ncbi:hypothetical protein BJV82DRAFT_672965 [Fennellomyces sp. T-0311]|nr:hypothetical protein BJV82DRAFT_672965 [Fennellomyces sp. T-0311]
MRRAIVYASPIRPRFSTTRCFSQTCIRSIEEQDPLDVILNRQLEVKDQPKKSVSDATRDLQKVLSQLTPFNSDDKPAKPISEPSKKGKRIHSQIEKQLLNMVLNSRQPHKKTSPLPRGMMGPIYGIKADRQKRADDTWRPETLTVDDQTIAARDKENSAINTVLECASSRDLLQCVLQFTAEQPTYYAALLKHAIEQASMSFRDPYLAISIFEHAKQYSVSSYVSGCTTDVYNAMLMMRWKLWRDIHGMLNLVDEMMANGVGYNGETRRIVQMAVAEVEQDIRLEDDDAREKDGQIWSMDERRSANVMKVLVGKWLVK